MPADFLKMEEVNKNFQIVEFCHGKTADGRDYYAFVGFSPKKYMEFVEAFSMHKKINLPEMGEVILTGWGKYPTQCVINHVREKYNLSMNFEEELADALVKLKALGVNHE